MTCASKEDCDVLVSENENFCPKHTCICGMEKAAGDKRCATCIRKASLFDADKDTPDPVKEAEKFRKEHLRKKSTETFLKESRKVPQQQGVPFYIGKAPVFTKFTLTELIGKWRTLFFVALRDNNVDRLQNYTTGNENNDRLVHFLALAWNDPSLLFPTTDVPLRKIPPEVEAVAVLQFNDQHITHEQYRDVLFNWLAKQEQADLRRTAALLAAEAPILPVSTHQTISTKRKIPQILTYRSCRRCGKEIAEQYKGQTAYDIGEKRLIQEDQWCLEPVYGPDGRVAYNVPRLGHDYAKPVTQLAHGEYGTGKSRYREPSVEAADALTREKEQAKADIERAKLDAERRARASKRALNREKAEARRAKRKK